MNYYPVWFLVKSRQTTDRQTDRKRRIWAHRAKCTGGLKNHIMTFFWSLIQYKNAPCRESQKGHANKIMFTVGNLYLKEDVFVLIRHFLLKRKGYSHVPYGFAWLGLILTFTLEGSFIRHRFTTDITRCWVTEGDRHKMMSGFHFILLHQLKIKTKNY